MASFTTRVDTTADISAVRKDVWAAITDPQTLTELTPLLSRIDADGDLWTWHMIRIAALGVSIVPSFTERMTFSDDSRIEYTHEPPAGTTERTGAEGVYELTDVEGGTRLQIALILSVELPLPRLSAKAVERVMRSTMTRTGDKFSANLLKHLDAHEL